MAIGLISVSILMGVLALGWRQVYLFWFFPIMLGVVAVLRIRYEPAEDAVDDDPVEDAQRALFSLSLAVFLVFIAIRTVAGQMVDAFIPIYLVDKKGLSEAMSSLIYGSGSLLGLMAAPVGGLLTSRFGESGGCS